jgi:putative FmdB family regulatory protein
VLIMPLYEYACSSCAAEFSRLRPLAAAGEAAACPQCGAAAARTLSAFAVHRQSEATQPTLHAAAPASPLCKQYPHIPLVCHMEPEAARRWIAKAEGREEQYLEREARRHEAAVQAGQPPPVPIAAHTHHTGHHHTSHVTPRPPGTQS